MVTKKIKPNILVGLLVLSLGLVGCSATRTSGASFFDKITPYKPMVIQGNFVAEEKLAKIRPGISKEEVQYYLGTPLIIDAFDSNKWYYAFNLNKKSVQKNYNLELTFSDNVLVDIKNNDLPKEAQAVEIVQPKKIKGRAVKTKLTEQELAKLKQQYQQANKTVDKAASSIFVPPPQQPNDSTSDVIFIN